MSSSARIKTSFFAFSTFPDSFFTERYLPLSDEYLRALQESDLSMRTENFESRNFLLIQSTADVLVHQQHSLILAKTLVERAIGFRHQVNKSLKKQRKDE